MINLPSSAFASAGVIEIEKAQRRASSATHPGELLRRRPFIFCERRERSLCEVDIEAMLRGSRGRR
jgi:hypothetical protein